MRNTISDLNNYLFEALERINDDELDEKALQDQILKAEQTCKIADKIIQNGELAFKASKAMMEAGYEVSPPALLGVGSRATT